MIRSGTILALAAILIVAASVWVVRRVISRNRPRAVMTTVDGSLYRVAGKSPEFVRDGDSIRFDETVRSTGSRCVESRLRLCRTKGARRCV